VKDQDGNLLGYEQFYEFKKNLTAKDLKDQRNSGKVGGCIFHANPSSTRAIQIFALYRDREIEADGEDDTISKTTKGEEKEEISVAPRKQVMFYSKLLAMEEISSEVSDLSQEEEEGKPLNSNGDSIQEDTVTEE
jgi:hypothetical protein